MKSPTQKSQKITLFLISMLKKVEARLQQRLHDPLTSGEQEILSQKIEILPELAGIHKAHTSVYKTLFRALERQGVHVVPNHFYYPIPDTNELLTSGVCQKVSDLPGIDMHVEDQKDLLCSVFPQYREEYNQIPLYKTDDLLPYQFHFNNSIFDHVDAFVLYCMIRHFKPRNIIEVGSGWSTRLSAQAAVKNGSTRLVSIEPYPGDVLQAGFPGLDSLITKKVQEVDPSVFEQLGEGDILFIDTSHVIKTGNDVNYLYLEILPRIQKGVIVHIHDIFLPQEYPAWWMSELFLFWTEQYLLQSFLTYNSHFRVLFANNYMRMNYLDLVKEAFPTCTYYDVTSSFWMKKAL